MMITLRSIQPSDYQSVEKLIFNAFVNTEEGYGNEAKPVWHIPAISCAG